MHNETQHTVFNEHLIRWSKDTWAWSDHTPAPQVKDITPSWEYNFRIQGGYIEVPVKEAASDPILAWVKNGNYPTAQSGDHYGQQRFHADGRVTRISQDGKAIPQIYRVPIAEWDEWNAITILGAKWDKQDEPLILEKAKQLNGL